MRGYGVSARPLTNLLKKWAYHWTTKVEEVFQQLKRALTTTPVLTLLDLKKPFTIETDASQSGIEAVLMQDHYPVAFISKMLSPKNHMMSIYDKELLALVHTVEKWQHYMFVLSFTIRTYQKSLRYLLEQRLSTPSQYS